MIFWLRRVELRVDANDFRLNQVVLSAEMYDEQQSALRCAKRVPAGRNRRQSSGLRPGCFFIAVGDSVGPFCRKGLCNLLQLATKPKWNYGQPVAFERTFAHGFELRSKVLLGKEDLPSFTTVAADFDPCGSQDWNYSTLEYR